MRWQAVKPAPQDMESTTWVCALLFNLDPPDPEGVLTSFQNTRFYKERNRACTCFENFFQKCSKTVLVPAERV